MAKLDREAKIDKLRVELLEWYARNRRDLPWRRSQNSYAIWVSEIMLQQTRVAVVVDRYQAFMGRFPTLVSLALAPEEDVLALWSGLGYYRRARMLHKAAQFVADHHQGNLPKTSEQLRLLPGIGAYTAAAIASIAHGECVAVVDGNVERVICRLSGWDAGSRTGGAALRRKIEALAGELVDPAGPGDFNQAMMELGATVCTPRSPQCLVCPLALDCKTRGEHKTQPRPPMLSRAVAHALSVRIGKQAGETNREVLLEQRPTSQTVMPGLWELPMLREAEVPEEELRMTVRHAIMQVNYYVRIRTVFEDDVTALAVDGGERRWVPLGAAAGMALTGLTRKVLTRAHLLPSASLDSIAPQADADVL
ncbi:MAG: A/G-specific adenine glycosylase [Terracidiphilus sp.]|nr:A/G-specific adenine glycosylase [Terracidiphilus sp.]MDR3776150.1 A/G-specific adenine glycosylase [Terracidiphilus sp.]